MSNPSIIQECSNHNRSDILSNLDPTHDNAPKLIKALAIEVFNLNSKYEKLLEQLTIPKIEPVHWFDLDGLVAYDPEKRGKPTFYGYVARNEIPFHKRGKKLTFLKSEIDEWLISGRKKTNSEIESEALHLLNRKSRRA